MACSYLKERGYEILERNFRRKWGEIDIICRKYEEKRPMFHVEHRGNDEESVPRGTIFKRLHGKNTLKRQKSGKLVFIEVKTLRSSVLRPEENVTVAKQRKLIRTCELYLEEKHINLESDWQIDVLAIILSNINSPPVIRHIEQAVY